MKNKAVKAVFKKRPEKKSGEENSGHGSHRQVMGRAGNDQPVGDQGQKNH